MKKITVIGAGNVGATTAKNIAAKDIAEEIVLLDVKEGLAEGKALDIKESSSIEDFDSDVIGYTDDYSKTADSDITVITSGITRKPGMSRDDLIYTNATIIKEVTRKIMQYSSNTMIIVVSNPLDVMTYIAFRTSGLPSNRVFGMAGVLDAARLKTFVADELDVSPNDVQTLLLGGHGDAMVPLPRYTTVSGIPITELIPGDKLNAIVERTRNGGGEILNLMGTSAFVAPAAAITQMVDSIAHDRKTIMPVCTLLKGQYGMKNIFIGVPVVIGKNGVEKVIEIDLNEMEKQMFEKSADDVRAIMEMVNKVQETTVE